jgi:hypothetical protein
MASGAAMKMRASRSPASSSATTMNSDDAGPADHQRAPRLNTQAVARLKRL